MLPSESDWIPYSQAGFTVGKSFLEARRRARFDRQGRRINSEIKLSGMQLAQFAARVTTQKLERPTIIAVDADVWRNERGKEQHSKTWPQLKNDRLYDKRDVLDFQHVPGHNCKYQRSDPELENLLAVIRFRFEGETPHCIVVCVRIEKRAIQPTNEQAQACLRVCQLLSNYYRDIQLFRFDAQVGDVYILADPNIEIVVPSTGAWYFL